MFIHWGLYAIPARGEWVRSVERISYTQKGNLLYAHLFEESVGPVNLNGLAGKVKSKAAI